MIFNDVGTHRFENIDHPFIPLAVMEVQAGDREFGGSQCGSDQGKRHRRPIASHGYFTCPVGLRIRNLKVFIVARVCHLDSKPLHPIERQPDIRLFQSVADGDGDGSFRKRARQKQAGDELAVEALKRDGSSMKRA